MGIFLGLLKFQIFLALCLIFLIFLGCKKQMLGPLSREIERIHYDVLTIGTLTVLHSSSTTYCLLPSPCNITKIITACWVIFHDFFLPTADFIKIFLFKKAILSEALSECKTV